MLVDDHASMVATFSAAGVITVGLVALIYTLVFQPSQLRAAVRTVSTEQLELQHPNELPRQQRGTRTILHTDRIISNENRFGGRSNGVAAPASPASPAAYEQFVVGAGWSSSEQQHEHEHEEQQMQPQNASLQQGFGLFGESSLFSADDALGLDWAQVRAASQRAKKDKASATTPAAWKQLEDELDDAPAAPPSKTTADYYFSVDSTFGGAADLSSAVPLASTFSKLQSRGSQLRATAPAWTPSGGIMFSLGSTSTTATTTATPPSTPTKKTTATAWQSAPSKSGKRYKRPKSQSHLITTPSRRTSVKNNPFAALEV